MAILKFDKRLDFTNRFTLHPSRSFISSSDGITGSVRLSHVKEGRRLSLRTDQYADQQSTIFNEAEIATAYHSLLWEASNDISASIYDPDWPGGTNFYGGLNFGLLSGIDQWLSGGVGTWGPDKKTFEIERFTPYLETTFLSSSSATAGDAPLKIAIASDGAYRKNTIRKLFYPDHVGSFRKCNWAYSNAHTINFFTASSVDANCTIIYPDPTGSDGSAKYRTDKGFTFEFFINPRYTTDNEVNEFHAGTILHYSSAYALSLVSGSSKDINGRPDGFRLMLQLSSSADTAPDLLALNAAPAGGREMVYSSSDNSLSFGNWHHVAVRWGGGVDGVNPVQDGTGSFVIDGKVDATFAIPSSSIVSEAGTTSYVQWSDREDSNALFIGNYFNGTNAGSNAIASFFNANAAIREGVTEIEGAAGSLTTDPPSYGFANKLNAELHEVRIFKEFRDINQIQTHMSAGFDSTQFTIEKSGSLAFYLPPFFVTEAPLRNKFIKPFNLSADTLNSYTPFNVSSEMFDINAPNFLRDFVSERYPRLFNLTGSTTKIVNNNQHANRQLLQDGEITARNLLILPNDNGLFNPGYDLLMTGAFESRPTVSSPLRSFVNDRGTTDFSIITLNRMLGGTIPKKYNQKPGDELYEPTYPEVNPSDASYSEAFWNDQMFEGSSGPDEIDINSKRIIGTSFQTNIYNDTISPAFPAESSVTSKTMFYVFETTGDESSNQAVFFNIPNVFYGKGIKPGTLTLRDSSVTGSSGKISMVLKDDGFGSLYRANSNNPNKLHSVGNVFYNQGIVAIKSPHLFQFGSGSFEIGFKGTQDVFNREILVEAPKNLLNSSSNPTFKKLAPTDNANETADEFVYITTVLLHDDDLNVIGRATLSQPIVKRVTDGITFRLKKDF